MSRASLLLIILLALIVGGVVALTSIDTEVPLKRVEKAVANDAKP
ncbi:hypothetical protein [Sphingomonas oleivorans]|nr:hypothetical protein [Sphingomonas oleivorans]